MKNATKKFAIATIIAAAAGYLAGILTAPKSGKETRKDIKDTAVKGINEAEKQLKRLHTELSELLGQAKEGAAKVKGQAKEDFEAAVNFTKEAKERVRNVLSSVHEGDADDKDLQKAIKDAQKAVDDLKGFLKKG